MAPNSTRTLPKVHRQSSTSHPKVNLDETSIHEWTKVFKLLADPSRLKIVLALAQTGEMHVTALTQMLDQSQPAVSHHLTLMRNVDLVGCRREGKKSFYYLTLDRVQGLLAQLFSPTRNGLHQLEVDDLVFTYKWR